MRIDALTLLERWQQGRLDDAGVALLKRLLADPQAAAALAAEVRHVHALREVLQQRRAAVDQRVAWWRRPAALAAAALLIIGIGAGLLIWPATSGWQVVDGTVMVERAGTAHPAISGTPLQRGDVLRTARDMAVLRSADGTRIDLAVESVLRAAALDGATRFVLDQGSVTCAVAPQGPAGFAIHTAQAEVVVRGTRFTVAADAELTRVQVAEGRVAVRRPADGTELELTAGGRTSVRTTGDLRDEAGLQPGPAWSDRRPLALLRLWTATDQPGNPRSYAHVPPGVDLTTPEGRTRYATALAEAGRVTGARLAAAGYQGVIVWDVEGKQHNDLLYVGDPRRLPELAPEMEVAADGFFAALARAGLRTGVLLRPQRLERDAGAPAGWRQRGDADATAELLAKATWARKRWGCSLFFINAMTATPGVDGRHLPAGTLASLATALGADRGETLLITDRPADDDWGVAAGWLPVMANGPAPLGDALTTRHPNLLRVNYWPAGGAPPAIAGPHEILMREADHILP